MTVNQSVAGHKRATREDTLSELKRFSRDPFMEILADMMQAAPTESQLMIFAAKNPDKWANAIATLAKISGFHDKLEIEQNINVKIQGLGDAELYQMIEDMQKELLDITPTSHEDAEDEEGEKKEEPSRPLLLEYHGDVD